MRYLMRNNWTVDYTSDICTSVLKRIVTTHQQKSAAVNCVLAKDVVDFPQIGQSAGLQVMLQKACCMPYFRSRKTLSSSTLSSFPRICTHALKWFVANHQQKGAPVIRIWRRRGRLHKSGSLPLLPLLPLLPRCTQSFKRLAAQHVVPLVDQSIDEISHEK